MSIGAWFLIIVFGGFIFFATQPGSGRGPGATRKDLLYLVLFIIVGIVLWFMLAGAHVAVVAR